MEIIKKIQGHFVDQKASLLMHECGELEAVIMIGNNRKRNILRNHRAAKVKSFLFINFYCHMKTT